VDGQEVLHDALCVIDSTREISEVENESNGDFLGMAISVCSLAGRANKAARCKSIFCYQGFQGYLAFAKLINEDSPQRQG
jgi:hypothetical protein